MGAIKKCVDWARKIMARCPYCGEKVAEAIVAKVERPGLSACEHSGRFKSCWKVFWDQEDFRDLRQ